MVRAASSVGSAASYFGHAASLTLKRRIPPRHAAVPPRPRGGTRRSYHALCRVPPRRRRIPPHYRRVQHLVHSGKHDEGRRIGAISFATLHPYMGSPSPCLYSVATASRTWERRSPILDRRVTRRGSAASPPRPLDAANYFCPSEINHPQHVSSTQPHRVLRLRGISSHFLIHDARDALDAPAARKALKVIL